jgi:hypothetical protein
MNDREKVKGLNERRRSRPRKQEVFRRNVSIGPNHFVTDSALNFGLTTQTATAPLQSQQKKFHAGFLAFSQMLQVQKDTKVLAMHTV